MRLKSFSGLFLMFQLMVNWFCLLIDASSPIHVVCRFDISQTSEITELYLNTCSHIVLYDFISSSEYWDEDKCKLQMRSRKRTDFMKKAKRFPQLMVMLSVMIYDVTSFLSKIRECRKNKNNSIAIVEYAVVDSLKEIKFDGLEIWVDRFDTTEDLKHIQKDLKKNGLLFSINLDKYHTEADVWKKIERLFDLRLVDFINLNPSNVESDGLAYHQSPLFKNFPMEHNSRFFAIDDGLTQLRAVYQPGKIVIEIPLWGYSWTIPSNVTDTRPPVTAITGRKFMRNRKICRRIQTEGWQVFYEDVNRNISPYAVSPFTGSNRTWVSFDDPATVVFKLKYALSNKLGGVYLYRLFFDDFNNTCGLGTDQTLMAIATTLNATLPSTIPTDEVFNRTNIHLPSTIPTDEVFNRTNIHLPTIPTDEIFNRTIITLPSVKVNKNMSIRCHVAFGLGLLVVVSYVIVLIYIFVKCYLITRRKDNLYDDVVVIYENVQPTLSMH